MKKRKRRRGLKLFAALLAALLLFTVPLFADENGLENGYENGGALYEPEPEPARPLPSWVFDEMPPDWIFHAEDIPDWFFELEREPLWFREAQNVPGWFHTIEFDEPPSWFFPDEPEPYENGEEPYYEPYENGDRPFPDWVTFPLPNWMFEVYALPDWFFDLEREPVWFRSIETVPAWFFTLTEIPDWFFQEGDDPVEEDDPQEDDPPEMPEPGREPETDAPPPPPERRMYTTRFPDGSEILSNIPNGMTTNGPVELTIHRPDSLTITKDGEPFHFIPGIPITEHGRYTVLWQGGGEIYSFSFRIITRPIHFMNDFRPPEGFGISSVTINGEPRTVTDEHSFIVQEEGAYVFTITADDDDEHVYTVLITIDESPPVLVFRRMDGDYISGEALEFIGDGSDAFRGGIHFEVQGFGNYTVRLVHNRVTAENPGNILTDSGRYTITVTDEAGNETVYVFRILYSMELPIIGLIAIGVVLTGALAAYLVRNRMKARVR